MRIGWHNSGKVFPRPFFRHFLISYLFMLLVPVLLTSYAHYHATRVATTASLEARMSIMEHSKNIIDKNLQELDEMVVQISLDPDLNALKYLDMTDSAATGVARMIEARKKFSFFRVTNEFKRRPYVFYTQSEIILSSNRINRGLEFHYRFFLNYPEVTFDAWQESVLQNSRGRSVFPAQLVSVDGKDHRIITYVTSLPRTHSGRHTGVVLFLIDEGLIHGLLKQVNAGSAGSTFVADDAGNILTRISGDEIDEPAFLDNLSGGTGHLKRDIGNEVMLVTYTTSEYNHWRYVSAVPSRLVLDSAEYIRNMTLGVVLAVLVFGIASALLLSYAKAQPLKDVFSVLWDRFSAGQLKPKNEFKFLTKSVHSLMVQNQELRSRYKAQYETLQLVFVGQLLKGDYQREQELPAIQAHLGVLIGDRGFVVAIVNAGGTEEIMDQNALAELHMIRAAVDEVLRRDEGDGVYPYVLSAVEMALLISLEKRNGADWLQRTTEIVRGLTETLLHTYGVRSYVGIGQHYDTIEHIHFSFREAQRALDYHDNRSGSENLCWYAEIKGSVSGYYYPEVIESRLINNTRTGHRNEVTSILDTIYQRNFVDTTLSSEMEQHLYSDMQGSLVKLASDFALPSDLSERILGSVKAVTDIATFDAIQEIFLESCSIVDENGKRNRKRVFETILKTIQNEYMQWDLSPKAISTRLNVSEYFVSELFKEQSGTSFSSYLERTRITVACERLGDGPRKISEVAVAVGYANVYTFRRAFKRLTGVVPTDYRAQPQSVDSDESSRRSSSSLVVNTRSMTETHPPVTHPG